MPIAAPTWPQATTVDEIRHNLQAVRERIARACALAGRDPASVRLLPVSKTVDEARLRMAWDAGCHELGENKVQEAQRKAAAMADLPGLRWSVIGHLQTNKARDVARFASEFQALDSLRVAQALDQRLELEQRTLDVFVQVNTSGEDSKYGLDPIEVADFVQQLPAFSNLRVRGLMTLGSVLARSGTGTAVLRETARPARAAAPHAAGGHQPGGTLHGHVRRRRDRHRRRGYRRARRPGHLRRALDPRQSLLADP